LMEHSFITHDRELFRVLAELGRTRGEAWPIASEEIDYSSIKPIEMAFDHEAKKWCQFIDFETAHELFKVTFCFLLKAEEYEAALNSLQFDQSMCRRVARITGHMDLESLAYNRYPMVLHHTNSVSERFVYHGVSLEHLHAFLIQEAEERAEDGVTAHQSNVDVRANGVA